MMLSLSTAYRSFDGEVEASSTPTICRLPDSRRHQIWAIAQRKILDTRPVPRSQRRGGTRRLVPWGMASMCPDAAICKLSRLQETLEFGKFDVDKLDLIVKDFVRECFRLKERHHKLCSGPVRYHARRNRPVG